MNQKRIAFGKPTHIERAAETWVGAQTQSAPPMPTARLTLDLPAELHRRLKVRCAERGERMADVLRGLLERELVA